MSACDTCHTEQPDAFHGARCPHCGVPWRPVPTLREGATLEIATGASGNPRRFAAPPVPPSSATRGSVGIPDGDRWGVSDAPPASAPESAPGSAPGSAPEGPSARTPAALDPMSVFRAPTRPAGLGLPNGESYESAIRSTQSMGVEEVQARVATARAALDGVRRKSHPGPTPVPPPPGTRPIQQAGTSSPPVDALPPPPAPPAPPASPAPPAVPVSQPGMSPSKAIRRTSLGLGVGPPVAPPGLARPPNARPPVTRPPTPLAALRGTSAGLGVVSSAIPALVPGPPTRQSGVSPSGVSPSGGQSDPPPEMQPPAPWEVDDEVRGARITLVGPATAPPPSPRTTNGSMGGTVTLGGPRAPVVSVRRNSLPGAPPRMPVLASDILREDLVPHEPGVERLRSTFALAGTLLVIAPLVGGALDEAHLRSWSMPGAVALLAGLAPLRYVHRAVLTLAAALPALALTLLADGALSRGGASLTTALLAWLPAALLFRMDFRASRRARVFVGIGIAAGVAWVLAPGAGDALVRHGGPWIPAHLAAVGLLPVLVLSLLGFMGSNTTAGCGVWASALVAWSSLLALRPLLEPTVRRDGDMVRLLVGQGLAAGTLTALVSVALASAAAVYLRPTEPQQPLGPRTRT